MGLVSRQSDYSNEYEVLVYVHAESKKKPELLNAPQDIESTTNHAMHPTREVQTCLHLRTVQEDVEKCIPAQW